MRDKSESRQRRSWRYPATAFSLALLILSATFGAHVSVAALQTSAPTVFAVIGDFGVDDANEAAVKNLVDGWSPSFIATVGDNFYSSAVTAGDTGNDYQESVGKYFCAYLKDVAGAGTCPTGTSATNRFFPAMGNHEYSDALPAPGTYTGYFTLPGTGVTTTGSSGNERYYDYIQGQVHVFVLDSNTEEPDGTSSTSVQAQWLQKQLAASTSTWNIVLFHHPPYSSDNVHGSTTYMQWPFAQWGADAVLSGHAHDYERINGDGIVYIVDGLGAAQTYGFGTPVSGSQVRYTGQHGAERVTATDTSLTFELVTVDGVVQDSYTANKSTAATATPTAGSVTQPTPSPTSAPVIASPTPTATALPSVHVGDLAQASVRTQNTWTPAVTILVHDAAHNPVPGVAVTANWSEALTGASACLTGADGRCTIALPALPASTKSAEFTVTNMTATGAAYDSSANHDPDGDSNGTTIMLTR